MIELSTACVHSCSSPIKRSGRPQSNESLLSPRAPQLRNAAGPRQSPPWRILRQDTTEASTMPLNRLTRERSICFSIINAIGLVVSPYWRDVRRSGAVDGVTVGHRHARNCEVMSPCGRSPSCGLTGDLDDKALPGDSSHRQCITYAFLLISSGGTLLSQMTAALS